MAKESDSPDTSKQHERTRRDHSMETAEDYVEAVLETIEATGKCRVVDLARRFAVSHVTVTKTVSRLKAAGYLDSEPYKPIELTAKGKRLAKESKLRHEVVYNFLLAIGVTPGIAAVDAEGLEHHVSKETLSRLKELTEKLNGGE
ncbi:MAG: manganese-binding transcriptional regulator MntR [Planctomycetota bacterium]